MNKYQGPVPQGYSVSRFRETGRTSKMVKGKEVLAKDSLNEKSKKKEKKKKFNLKGLSKKLSYKKSPASKTTLTIKDYKAESIWDDPNRFFKSEMEETKRSMFQ